MRLLKDGRWKLTNAETAELAKDPAFLKASGQCLLWGGTTGGDRNHPEVIKAGKALGRAVAAWVACKATKGRSA